MKDTIVLGALYLSLGGIAFSAAISQNNIADNQKWFSDQTNPLDGGIGPYGTIADNSPIASATNPEAQQHFDERSLTFTDLSGTVIDELLIVTDLTPLSGTPRFDDSFGVDLNSDNVIDFAFTEDDAINTTGVSGYGGATAYNPWTDATPMVFEITITSTGTTIDAFWRGFEIEINGATAITGFDNISSLTLADLGFNLDGSVPSNNFTTTGVRIGPLNSKGGSAGSATDFNFDAVRITDDTGTVTVFDPDGDGVPAGIPEPSSTILLGISGLALVTRRRK